MINLKYQFIRRLLGISLSICTAYGAMRSAFVMAGTLDTTPGAILVAEAKTEQAADDEEVRAEGTAASGEEVNEFVIEEISEDIEAIEDVEVNEDIEAVEDIDQEVDEDVLKEEAAEKYSLNRHRETKKMSRYLQRRQRDRRKKRRSSLNRSRRNLT